ncbi:hypothetical protein G6F42_028322 [Rhizopus arrhizus]|nr:hypothetical protein G6F42_028322 [Rhizopus arrhizus]
MWVQLAQLLKRRSKNVGRIHARGSATAPRAKQGSTTSNLYHSASTEWSDGTKSDVLYVPTEVSDDQPPILIEIQNIADQTFMTRLIQYCARGFERYKVLPAVLVFVAVKFSGKEFEKKIVTKVNTPYLLKTPCEF